MGVAPGVRDKPPKNDSAEAGSGRRPRHRWDGLDIGGRCLRGEREGEKTSSYTM